jgi:hypothetical protein
MHGQLRLNGNEINQTWIGKKEWGGGREREDFEEDGGTSGLWAVYEKT